MPKSAQQRFNEYLDECRSTGNAVDALVRASHNDTGNYAYAAGYLSSLLQDAIGELPRARREDYRRRLLRSAESFKKEVDTQAA